MAVIYAFGDSITYGAWDIEKGGWVARLRHILDQKQEKDPDLYYILHNLGIPSETTEGLVARFETETEARSRENEEAIFLFAFGANDAAFITKDNKFKVSVDDYSANLATVLAKARAISPKIIMLNVLPVHEEVYAKLRPDKIRVNAHFEEYNQAAKALAEKEKAHLVDVFSRFMEAGHAKLFSDDGVHPNARGHALIAETVLPVLEKLLAEERIMRTYGR